MTIVQRILLLMVGGWIFSEARGTDGNECAGKSDGSCTAAKIGGPIKTTSFVQFKVGVDKQSLNNVEKASWRLGLADVSSMEQSVRQRDSSCIPPGMQAVTTHGGYQMVVMGDNDIVSKDIATLGYWEILDVDDMASKADVALPKSGTFLDIGANVGYYTLLFAHKGYNVIAVEPMTRNRRAIEASLCLNPELKGLVTVIKTALVAPDEVADKRCLIRSTNEEINIGNGKLKCGDSMIVEPCAEGDPNCEEVPVETLDSALAKVGPTSVDVVKMDVEKYECNVFAGAGNLFEKYRPTVLQVETAWGNAKECVEAEAAKHSYRTSPAGSNTVMVSKS